MSDKAEKKKDEKPAEGEHGEAKKGGGIGALLTKLPVLLGGAMTVEAVVMLVAFKLLAGGPKTADAAVDLKAATAEHADAAEKPAAAAEGHGEAAAKPAEGEGHGEAAKPAAAEGHGEAAAGDAAPADPNKPVELAVVEFRAPNKIGGRTFLYDVSIYAVTKAKNKSVIESAIKDRGALLKDRIRTIIAQSDPTSSAAGQNPASRRSGGK